MSNKLSLSFRAALINYLKNPDDSGNKKYLAATAFAIYIDAVTTHGLEPDKYLPHIDEIVRPAISGIAIHPQVGKTLDSFNRELSYSDLTHENQAFHVLTLAYNEYLKNNFINLEKIIWEQLEIIQTVIQELKMHKNPYVKELESTYVELTVLIDNYFKLPMAMQFKQYVNFEKELRHVCFKHKEAIESSMQSKVAFYNFLTMICFIFTGVVFFDRFQKTSLFFQRASISPRNVLSGFTPNVEISESPQTLKAH